MSCVWFICVVCARKGKGNERETDMITGMHENWAYLSWSRCTPSRSLNWSNTQSHTGTRKGQCLSIDPWQIKPFLITRNVQTLLLWWCYDTYTTLECGKLCCTLGRRNLLTEEDACVLPWLIDDDLTNANQQGSERSLINYIWLAYVQRVCREIDQA